MPQTVSVASFLFHVCLFFFCLTVVVAKDSLSLIERFLLAKNDQQNTFSDRRNSEKIEVHIYLAYISFFKCYNGNQ